MADLAKIRQHVESNSERYIEMLKDACRIPSVSAEGEGFAEMSGWLEEKLVGLGATVERLSVNGSPDALLGVIPGAGSDGNKRTLMIYDHYDVQPVDPIDLWVSPPFEPTLREGRIYARGAADNKGDLIARLSALEAHQQLFGPLPYDIKFFIEGEEESGSGNFENICHTFADKLKADDCVWEGGWFDHDGRAQMFYGCKGLLYVELNIKKLSGDQHSSIAVYAPSAAWQLLRAIDSLKDESGRITIEGFYDDIVEPGDKEMALVRKIPFNEEATKKNLGIDAFVDELSGEALMKNLLYTPTCNIAGFTTGYGVPGASKTVLPAHAMAKLDFRLVPDQSPEDVAKKLQRHFEDKGFEDVEIQVLGAEHPSRSPVDTPLAAAAESVGSKWFDQPVSVYPLMWATGPMYPIAQGLGIPICSPPGVGRPDSNLHAPNENARVADFINIVGYTVAYLNAYGEA